MPVVKIVETMRFFLFYTSKCDKKTIDGNQELKKKYIFNIVAQLHVDKGTSEVRA